MIIDEDIYSTYVALVDQILPLLPPRTQRTGTQEGPPWSRHVYPSWDNDDNDRGNDDDGGDDDDKEMLGL